ncbi:hypothetical protein [Flavobacterium saccharophilum]|uniref:Uncharacterized protein n=1 Tax=Flavobacterium saccharophilum TaxID=29534 RepID=A0A1M6ZLF5_9FLAO|nr:hypothetical protein [Flavobacterium saccharophilum]SHL31286.1 hypothetical protein SAMN05444366_0316 [Flavobacterium saccharophilum]
MKNEDNLFLRLLDDTLNKNVKENIKNNYLKDLKNITKWSCFSDYCFDDKNKPNDVVTFSLVPYITDYSIIENHIKEIAKTDIKNTKSIQDKFITFLKEYPLINFSFILNDRKEIFGHTHDIRKENVLQQLNLTKDLYSNWIKNQPEKELYYRKIIKTIDSCISEVKRGKKINIYIDVFLVAFLGAYVSYIILNELKNIEIFGWFSDRDKIFDVQNGFIVNIFNNNLHCLLYDKQIPYQFVSSLSNSNFDVFYDQFIKIPDYIAGTLADYNMIDNLVSKDKFDIMLTKYMGNNTHNNFVFKIFKEDNQFNCAKISILKK